MGQGKLDTEALRIDGGLQLQEDQIDNSREMEVPGRLRIGFGKANPEINRKVFDETFCVVEQRDSKVGDGSDNQA